MIDTRRANCKCVYDTNLYNQIGGVTTGALTMVSAENRLDNHIQGSIAACCLCPHVALHHSPQVAATAYYIYNPAPPSLTKLPPGAVPLTV